MGAGMTICRKRTVCAVLASGAVISLAALTGGVAPALAKPGDGPGGPGGGGSGPTTTVVAPAPKAAPQQEQPAERPTEAKAPEAPAAPAAPAVPEAPQALAPEPSAAAPEPVAPEPVEAPAPAEAPKTRAPQPEPVEAPSQTRAPEPQNRAPEPSPSVTATTEYPSTAVLAPRREAPPATVPNTDGVAPAPSDIPAPRSPERVAPGPGADGPPASNADPTRSAEQSIRPSSRSDAPSSGEPAPAPNPAAPRVIERSEPQTLAAPEEDVQIAKSAKVVEEKPVAAPAKDIADISRVVDLPNPFDRDRRDQNGPRNDDQVRLAGGWDRNVRQWRPDWVGYDEYYRPVLSNPYRDPVRIVYVYDNAQRIATIPPLGRIVLEVAQYAAYSFTALVTNPFNQATNVGVGSFFGGGYNPGFGLPLPPPPPPLLNYANVPVQVRYSDATYEPFRVQKIVDVGDDPRFGERKVLLDGVTPAWGQWTQTPAGERSFEVHKTQQFPGLDDPREAPLPGDYQLRLASDETSSGMTKRDVYLIAVAVTCGALSIGAVVLAVMLGRRRRLSH